MTTALQSPPPAAKLLTYEAYMAEEEIIARYDIINGERIYMAGAKWWHQRISKRFTVIFDEYEQAMGVGKSLAAPFDIMIQRRPLQTRQPDLFFISNATLQNAGDYKESGCLEVAPELVVEIVSDSETEKRFSAKLTDYCAIGVQECWKVLRDTQTVEVSRLTPEGPRSVQVYGAGEKIQSITFPDLLVDVNAIFVQ